MKLPPLLWGVLAGATAILALSPAIGTALADLAAARAQRAEASEDAAAPIDVSLVAGAIHARDRDAANTAVAARVRAYAARGAVLVEEAQPLSDPAGLARVRLRLSGSEDAVIALVDTIERGSPVVRFARWQIEATGGAVRLQGELVAPWE